MGIAPVVRHVREVSLESLSPIRVPVLAGEECVKSRCLEKLLEIVPRIEDGVDPKPVSPENALHRNASHIVGQQVSLAQWSSSASVARSSAASL